MQLCVIMFSVAPGSSSYSIVPNVWIPMLEDGQLSSVLEMSRSTKFYAMIEDEKLEASGQFDSLVEAFCGDAMPWFGYQANVAGIRRVADL